jgi:hypothetical protein
MKNHKSAAFTFGEINNGVVCLALGLILGFQPAAHSQDANELARQQMQAMKQMMEAQGMSAEEIKEMEAMYKQSMGPIVEEQAAREAQSQADFEAKNAGLGKAVVSVGDEEFELQVTECVPVSGGDFRIQAKASYDSRSNRIWIGGESHYNRTVLQMLLKGVGEFDIQIQPIVGLENGRFAWTGTANGGRGPQDVAVTVQCGAES